VWLPYAVGGERLGGVGFPIVGSLVGLVIWSTVVLVWMLIWLCRRGTVGPNRHGPDPLAGGLAQRRQHEVQVASKAIEWLRSKGDESKLAAVASEPLEAIVPWVLKSWHRCGRELNVSFPRIRSWSGRKPPTSATRDHLEEYLAADKAPSSHLVGSISKCGSTW